MVVCLHSGLQNHRKKCFKYLLKKQYWTKITKHKSGTPEVFLVSLYLVLDFGKRKRHSLGYFDAGKKPWNKYRRPAAVKHKVLSLNPISLLYQLLSFAFAKSISSVPCHAMLGTQLEKTSNNHLKCAVNMHGSYWPKG